MSEKSIFKTQLIERVQDGMKVFDAEGVEVGTVEFVKMGDPEALTTAGNEPTVSAGYVPLTDDADEPEVPEPIRSDLLRVGYIKIDGPDLFDTDRYVRADVIAGVSSDGVTLSLPKARLAVETSESDLANVQPSHRVEPAERKMVVPPPAAGLGLPPHNM